MKDLIIKYNKNIVKFRFLEWDTVFFNKNAYMLDTGITKINVYSDMFKKFISKNLPDDSFIAAKIEDNADRNFINLFLSLDFKYVLNAVLLCLEKERWHGKLFYGNANPEIKILKKTENHDLPYEELGSSFSLTRFHLDSNIKKNKADKLWIEYLRNFNPDAKNHLFIAQVNKEKIGAALLKERIEGKSKIAEICFIAIIKKYQNKGVGKRLVTTVSDWALERNDCVEVGTQLDNVNALNFYIKNGFLIKKTYIVTHKWS